MALEPLFPLWKLWLPEATLSIHLPVLVGSSLRGVIVSNRYESRKWQGEFKMLDHEMQQKDTLWLLVPHSVFQALHLVTYFGNLSMLVCHN